MRGYDLETLLARPRETQTYLVKPLLPTGGAINIFGAPKTGKSFAALQLMAAVASGKSEWMGQFEIQTNGPVLYVQLDTPNTLWLERLEIMQSLGIDFSGMHFVNRDDEGTPFPFNVLNPVHQKQLKAEVERVQPVAVVMDTYRESFSGSENDSDIAQQVVAELTAAVRPAALVLISHTAKENVENPRSLVDAARGSGYIAGRMDGLMWVRHKSIRYGGRACEEATFKGDRQAPGIWLPKVEASSTARAVTEAAPALSLMDRARILAKQEGISIPAAKSRLVRVK
jgi:RecA-family ATPase